jgi:hypothetical protein
MIRNKLALLGLVTTILTASALMFGSIGAEGKPTTPKRVLIVLFDQMRPEYADRFDMPNFRRLRDQGTNFKEAYLGYMGSETVISHNVIVSGQLPKHQGWVDEAYRDTGNLLGSGPNKVHITGDLSLANFQTLVGHEGYPKLSDYLHATFPGTKFITVGEKSYAVESAAATGTPLAGDIAVRMSSRKNVASCATTLGGQYRVPQGLNVPTYLTDPFCGRYYVNADKANDYGTLSAFPSFMYPEEGNRFVPGTDAAHLGGDTWVADAAMAMMQNEPTWSGMFVTLGAIDKTGHMFGADQDTNGHDCSVGTGQVHVDCAAKNADAQLGRMLDKLKALGQLDDTLVVLTADHGATHGASFYGKPTLLAGDTNWYYDPLNASIDGGAPSGSFYNNPSPQISNLNAALGGNLQFSYQSTSIQAWLTDNSPAKKAAATAAMNNVAGVTASYWRDGDHYVLGAKNPMTKSEEKWWKKNGQQIIDGMAADNGPDVVGLLHDDTSYGVYGDHGGASEEVQRVPVVFWSSNGQHGNAVDETFRTPDIMPTILGELRIPLTHSVDGKAHKLK